MKKLENVRNILVVNLGGIGDVLLSTPALRALKDAYPDAEISLLVVPRVAELVRDLSYIDNVFEIEMRWSAVLKDILLLFTLRSRKFDIAINMRTLVTSNSARKMKLLFNIISSRVSAGRDTDGSGDFFGIKIPETRIGKRSEMEYDIETVAALGADVKDRMINISIDKVYADTVDRLLKERGIKKSDRLIGIHPGGRPSHRWPLTNFAKVIEELHRKTPCKFVITGDENEKGLATELARSAAGSAIELAGALNVKELAALIKRCEILISNDTAPIHIAAILKTPVVSLFGPGDVVRFDPKNISDRAVTISKNMRCAPCEKIECKDRKCLDAITVEEVVAAALRFMKN
jgi:ADP-heptose:LPS heptosyltransferase